VVVVVVVVVVVAGVVDVDFVFQPSQSASIFLLHLTDLALAVFDLDDFEE